MSWFDQYGVSGNKLKEEGLPAVISLTKTEADQVLGQFERNYPEAWARLMQAMREHNPQGISTRSKVRELSQGTP